MKQERKAPKRPKHLEPARTAKKMAKRSKMDRTQMMLAAIHQELVACKGTLNFLMTRDFLRSKDPRKVSALELTDIGKALGQVHPDLLEGWAQLLSDDPERQEALLAGVEESAVEEAVGVPTAALDATIDSADVVKFDGPSASGRLTVAEAIDRLAEEVPDA